MASGCPGLPSRILAKVTRGVLPSNGWWPVANSYRRTPEREEIGAEVGFLTFQLLGRHVGGGSEHASGLGHPLAGRGPGYGDGQSEIDNLQIPLAIQ